jgi:signal transduction histidine kinase/CheY-like chemotaxis protein
MIRMKRLDIKSRLTILLSFTGFVFLVVLLIIYFTTLKQKKDLLKESEQQFHNEINSLITLKTASLKQVVFDYTYWNDFVKNLSQKDTSWYNNNITTILKTYRIDYALVFDTAFNLVHHASSNGDNSRNIIEQNVLNQVKNDRFINYFHFFNNNLLEISGASVHDESDPSHQKTKPRGYLFLIKLWDNDNLKELEILSWSKLKIQAQEEVSSEPDKYTITCSYPLYDYSKNLTGTLYFSRESKSIQLFNESTFFLVLTFLTAILVSLIVFHFTIRLWVTKPLLLVSRILKDANPESITRLRTGPGEFRQIGELFSDFILQKEELRIAKDKAEESDKLKSAFLANMSHEIRTPMNGILGFADLLKSSNLSGDEQRQYIRIIEKSGIRMLNIINDIIDISKIESGLVTVMPVLTNINEQIDYIHSFFTKEANHKGINLETHKSLPNAEAWVTTDKEKVYAILTNLTKNAIKFTSSGTIEIGYNLRGSEAVANGIELVFYIKDSGIGIPVEKQKAIFERFIQANVAAKIQEGAGLGLAITKAYVEMLGGHIWVQSDRGNGAIFYFTLPYNPQKFDSLSHSGNENEVNHHQNITKLKILIAEDDEESKTLLNVGLKNYCSEIINVRTGKDAIEKCREIPDIDLILMDIQMPVLDGYDATKIIRQFNQDVIIIAQTAFGLIGDKEKAIESGCNDYISKPISFTALKALINKHFQDAGSK